VNGPTPQECNLSLETQVVSLQPANELPHDSLLQLFVLFTERTYRPSCLE
jgi:predicted transposase YdaD